jgi:hypothetical protein
VGVAAEFLKPFKLIWPVQLSLKKYFGLRASKMLLLQGELTGFLSAADIR